MYPSYNSSVPTMASMLSGNHGPTNNAIHHGIGGPSHQLEHQMHSPTDEGAASLPHHVPIIGNPFPNLPTDLTTEENQICLSSLMMSFPCWNDPIVGVPGRQHPPEHNPFKQLSSFADNGILSEDSMFTHSLGPIGAPGNKSKNRKNVQPGAIGYGRQSPGSSPDIMSSITSCGRCEISYGFKRCLDCNDILCVECLVNHSLHPATKDHCIANLDNASPIGMNANVPRITPAHILLTELCIHHKEVLRYVCEDCSKMVCQECTLWEHKEHRTEVISDYSDNALPKLQAALDLGKNGKQLIKSSIDRAVSYTQSIERDATDVSQKIRKSMRHFIMCIEEREKQLIEYVDAIRSQKVSTLSDQMIGLRAALSGLADNADNLNKAIENRKNLTHLDMCNILTKSDLQMEQFSMVYKHLQPKEEYLMFSGPSYELLQEIRQQGDIKLVPTKFQAEEPIPSPSGQQMLELEQHHQSHQSPQHQQHHSQQQQQQHHNQHHHSGGHGKGNSRRNSRNNNNNNNNTNNNNPPPTPITTWDATAVYQSMQTRKSPNTHVFASNVVGQAIPGSNFFVTVDPTPYCSTSFAFDGHADGEVSRPWGLCVDRDGHIIVADRRNNRVQVFFADGTFKLKFGTKGTGNGQFDLPAGISTDSDNRIVVVDKDNHRVQVFTASGMFINKFGSYGKECGQFQYPWDVAVNTRGEMLVTDSRNHRIQMFNRDGHFLSRFCFDGVNHSRVLKGLTTPRGICYTPKGDIIVSDFENHRLILIDSTLSTVIAHKGHEGAGIIEFSRPSGICCDDDGRVIVADSKNQRVMIYSPMLEFLFSIEIRPSTHHLMMFNNGVDEKDRPSDVALLPDGRLVVMVETSPDARDTSNPQKTFVQIY